jgi:hemolysin activation/secretion protein
VEKRGVERLDGIEDVDLGSSLRFRAGVSPEFLGGTTDEGYLAARWDAGVGTERFGFGTASLDVSSRLRHDPRELIAQANARWTNQSLPQQTFVIAAHGSVGHRVYRDYQVIVGGLNGLRAYPVRALAGQQLWRFNAEHRWPVASRLYQLVSIGAAAFYDAARTWGPGAEGVPWHHDVGLGMRLSLPHSRLARVARFDVAWPISPTRDGRRVPVFSFGSGQAF